MQKEEIKITVENGIKELVIRHGDAAPIELPKLIKLTGDIFSPGNFAEARKDLFEPKEAHVLVNSKDFSITLVTDEQMGRGHVVTGKLVKNRHLAELKINETAGFGIKELQQALKFRRTLFQDMREYTAIMFNLQNFAVKSQTEAKAADDRKGNVNASFQRTSQLDTPLEFTLNVPVFENTEAKTFKVEVLVDVRDAGITFFLESIELADLIETTRQEIFKAQLERLSAYVIINE